MGFDWRAYKGGNWTTDVKTQTEQNKCIAYGTIAALESMMKIHFYYNKNTGTYPVLSEEELWANMGNPTSPTDVPTACQALIANGINIPNYGNYKINDYHEIGSSIIKDDAYFENFNDEAKEYLETNGPLIADYDDPSIGRHCFTIIGYTNDDKWICKDSYPQGHYTEIGFQQMIDNLAGLYAILIREQELKISIKHRASPPTSITTWWQVYFRINKNGANLADLDPIFATRFKNKNGAWCNSVECSGWSLHITPKDGVHANLDNLVVVAGPGDYHIDVYVCANGNETAHADATLSFGDTRKDVEILLNTVGQCAKEILYPFALHAIEKHRSDMRLSLDELVAINELLRTAEISKEDFIKDLEKRIVDLDEACNIGIDGAQGTLRATKKILEQVKSI